MLKTHTFEPIFALNYLFKNLKLALSWNMSFKTLVFTKGESKKFQNSIIFRKFFTFISQGDERVLSAIKSNGRYNPFHIHPPPIGQVFTPSVLVAVGSAVLSAH